METEDSNGSAQHGQAASPDDTWMNLPPEPKRDKVSRWLPLEFYRLSQYVDDIATDGNAMVFREV